MKSIKWSALLKGAILLVLGIVLLCTPRLALSSMVFLLGFAVVLSGAKDIVFYAGARRRAGAGPTAILAKGLAGLLAGGLLLLNPAIGKWALNVLVPVGFIACFTFRLAGCGFMSRITGRTSVLMLCLNVLGLMLGILMLFNPMLFTMSFGVLAAILFLILGVSAALEAFRTADGREAVYEEKGW